MSRAACAAAALLAALLCTPFARADAVLEWNAILRATVADLPPPFQNRYATIMHLAVFDAVNTVEGGYRSYLDGIQRAADAASAEAAAAAAAHAVLADYFPGRATDLDAALATSLARIAESPARTEGVAIGKAMAARLMAARAEDGARAAVGDLPASANPGDWQLTPACKPSGGVFKHWQDLTPFVLRSASQFRSAPPPALDDERYTKAYQEVKAVGARNSTTRSRRQTENAQFYAGLGDAILWGDIARQISAARGETLAQNARAFALLHMALNDAGIALVETKYHYRFWRPETAIRAAGSDGNTTTDPDAAFEPLIRTPCHPSYPSGHATTSHAAREVLERLFGPGSHAITLSNPEVPGVVLMYSDLRKITDDIDDARVHGGVHFRFDQEAGAEQGKRVGAYVVENSLLAR